MKLKPPISVRFFNKLYSDLKLCNQGNQAIDETMRKGELLCWVWG